jgi:hypothetical protein
MKFAIVAEVAIVALVGFLTLSSAVNAAPTTKECWSLASTVKARLDANPNASVEARSHYRTGTDACARGFNSFGVTHLQAAMKALGG